MPHQSYSEVSGQNGAVSHWYFWPLCVYVAEMEEDILKHHFFLARFVINQSYTLASAEECRDLRIKAHKVRKVAT